MEGFFKDFLKVKEQLFFGIFSDGSFRMILEAIYEV